MPDFTRRGFLGTMIASAAIARNGYAVTPGKDAAMKAKKLTSGVFVLEGAVNTGVLIQNEDALLIDCCDSVTPERLEALGVKRVAMICCTQHRRPNAMGAYPFMEAGADLVVPEAERDLFEAVDDYWADSKNRWHLYHFQPGPQVLPTPLPVAMSVREGDSIEWGNYTLHVLDTPGATDGSVSYVVIAGDKTFCFSGDAIYGSGQIWDLHSLQKGFGGVRDYHGFLGNHKKLLPSLRKLDEVNADALIPSHGAVIKRPGAAIRKLEERLDALWRNYTATSALNHYFPELFDDTKDDPQRLPRAETSEFPSWIKRVDFTSFAVISKNGAAFLIDCGHDSVIDTLQQWLGKKEITSVDGCWVTHYHDDHVDSLHRFATTYYKPIMTDQHLAEIIEHPRRFFLPCISPAAAPVTKATTEGESWTWNEFTFTACHFPGQTLYHGGLLVEGPDTTAFFAGDSGAPSGLDDYTAGNRVFLGEGRGSRRTLAYWRDAKPQHILNQHQGESWSFTEEQLDHMDRLLIERETLIAKMTPWEDASFAVDEWWARTYPYDQDATPGATLAIDVEFTNHDSREALVEVEPVLPEGWHWDKDRSDTNKTLPARTDGVTQTFGANPDHAARIWITPPADAATGRYTVPFRITWNGRYLGAFRHGIVEVL